MFQELDSVALQQDDIEHGLQTGDIGAIVHCYLDQRTYEVEFVTADGATVAVATLGADDIRHIRPEKRAQMVSPRLQHREQLSDFKLETDTDIMVD